MRQVLTRENRQRRKKKIIIRTVVVMLLLTFVMLVFLTTAFIIDRFSPHKVEGDTIPFALTNGEEIEIRYLTPNPYSRPQAPLKKIRSVVIHYTANPGSTAANNRSYFEGLKKKKTTYASSHYIIGLDGEIIQCIPLTEISYASNFRNDDTVSIECCHPDATGEFTEETYSSMVALTAALCVEFGLNKEEIIRHYDVTGKKCPLYFVENEDAWDTFQLAVMEEVEIIKENQAKLDQE